MQGQDKAVQSHADTADGKRELVWKRDVRQILPLSLSMSKTS